MLLAYKTGAWNVSGCLPVSMGLLPVAPIHLATCFTPSPALCRFWFLPCTMRVGLPSGCHSASLITSHENWAVPVEVRGWDHGQRDEKPVLWSRLAHSEGKQESVAGQIHKVTLPAQPEVRACLGHPATTLSDVQSKVA